ncbi:MAG: hypothetical protein QM731_13375 [Chitinophagaceae bacterium]
MTKTRFTFGKLVALISFVTLFSACDKVKDALNLSITMEMANVEFTIPTQQVGTQTLAEISVPFNVDSLIKAKASGFSVNSIRSAKIKSCTLTLLNGTEANNFAALSACTAAFSSNNITTPVILAQLTSNPDSYATTLNLPVNSDTELKDYLKASSFSYVISGTTRRAITTALQCKATITYELGF